jgi:hypothetical protein
VPAVTEPTARCLIRELDELFVEEVVDPDEGRVYRPFGREVEPDESSEEAVREAFRETLGVDLSWVTELGEYDGVLVFEASADQNWLYDETGITVYDPEIGETMRLAWLHREDFEKYGETLRPDGLLADL